MMKRIFAILLCALLGLGLAVPAFAAGSYVISNPYEDVVWEGAGKWGAYKANLHTHTTFSDGDESIKTMVEAYYEQGYDVLASTDHGVVSKAWDKKPMTVPILGLYGAFKERDVLSKERLAVVTAGTDRGGRGMVQVPKGIEMNAATVYKSHAVGLYAGWGQGWIGLSTDYRTTVAGTDRCGGISFVAHPGDWIKSEFRPEAAKEPANIYFFADMLRDYDSCLGIEIYNGSDGVTRYDRVFWDEQLKRLIPEGRQVFAFANDDSHDLGAIGRTAEMLFMPGNDADQIRACLESGAFLACSRVDRIRLPEFNADRTKPFPVVNKITVARDKTSITISASATDLIEWIADGEVIATGKTVDLTDPRITCYVRAQLIGPGGITATQAFGVDKGDGYRHPDDRPTGWARAKWYANMYLKKNAFYWAYENIAKLLTK